MSDLPPTGLDLVTNETAEITPFDVYEKADEVRQVSDIISDARQAGKPARVLLYGGPGVGKSTASYDSLDHLKTQGLKPVWINTRDITKPNIVDRIANADAQEVIFFDSIDAVFDGDIDPDELEISIAKIKTSTESGKGPIIIANLHDPYPLPRSQMDVFDRKKELLIGENGLFSDREQCIEVVMKPMDDKSLSATINREAERAKVDLTWSEFLLGEFKRRGILTHNYVANILLNIGTKYPNPSELSAAYNPQSVDVVVKWLDQRLIEISKLNDKYNNAYYQPDNPDDAYKGLVRQDLIIKPKTVVEEAQQTEIIDTEVDPVTQQNQKAQKGNWGDKVRGWLGLKDN